MMRSTLHFAGGEPRRTGVAVVVPVWANVSSGAVAFLHLVTFVLMSESGQGGQNERGGIQTPGWSGGSAGAGGVGVWQRQVRRGPSANCLN
jgi:hypothetical protein